MQANPQRILKNRYQVVARTLILIFDGDRVLLLKGSQTKKLWAGYYNGLGGHIERGEDVFTAARREILEESGLAVEDLHLNGVVMIDVEPEQGICLFVFSGRNYHGVLRESSEGKLEWIKIDDLNSINCVEDIPLLIPRVMKNKFFSIQYLYDSGGKLQIVEGK